MLFDEATGLLPLDQEVLKGGVDLTGFNDNWWMGLSLLHTLFVKEHNLLCDRLAKEYPGHDDEWLFGKARLIVAGLMAKIHTVEWTPGILGHPAITISLNSNWSGMFGDWARRRFGRVTELDAFNGITGSSTEHHAAPFAMTEEFVAVYRLHPLIPDEVSFRSLADNSKKGELKFVEVQGHLTRQAMQRMGPLGDLLYSFGTQNPGKITLRNYPNSLRRFERMDGDVFDLAAVDILRDRERGIPRYNQFRRMVHKSPVRDFCELTGIRDPNNELNRTLSEMYGGDIERVDLQVGLFAEPLPYGFGFSDTAFRIFILMASRRLKSDRFFTVDYTPEVYTPLGIDWLSENTMSTLLLRHHPELEPALKGLSNAFAPWNETGAASK
jgi:hypothetical protein